MSETQSIGLQMQDRTERARQAIDDVVAALPGAEASAPDSDGSFEISVPSASYDDALRRVFDAVAAAGADDHLVFLEHPDIAHHWESRDETPG
jgi:hypothetical protein